MEEKMVVILDGKGNIEVETQNFVGKACDSTVDKIMVAIGGQVVKDVKKPEYYEDGDDPVRVFTNA